MSDDAILIEQTLARDPSVFERLVQRHKGAALALALQYVHNFHDAQDITQEAFCSAYIHLPKLADASRFRSWFFQIVMNHARMWVREQTRRSRREDTVGEDCFAAPVEHERFVESLVWREIIEKAMESLSSSDQAIATFYYRSEDRDRTRICPDSLKN
jgi:RNA polymerase sigma factor (sigma-70 family)